MEKVKGRILWVEAHPDDIAFTSAGTVVKLIAEGYQVDSLMMTDGNFSDDGEQRMKEQRQMMGLLGMGVLYAVGQENGFEDFYLNKISLWLIINTILEILVRAEEEGNPYKRIMTFDENGYSGHPDHIVVNEAVREIFQSEDTHGVKELWELGMSPEEKKLWGDYFVPIPDINLESYTPIDVDGEPFNKKLEAIKVHTTQFHMEDNGSGEAQIERLNKLPKVEWFKITKKSD